MDAPVATATGTATGFFTLPDGAAPSGLDRRVRELTDRLRDAERMAALGVAVSTVAHEINNLFAGAMSVAELAMLEQEEGAARQALETIMRTCRRACMLSRRLLGYAGGEQDAVEETDPAVLLEDTLALVRKELAAGGVEVETHVAATPPLRMPAAAMQQVLLNLFRNARDAMKGGGTLRVTVDTPADAAPGLREEGGRHLRVRVEDSGSGVPPEHLPRIFDAFYSTKRSADGSRGGSGLGLHVSRDILRQHGGDLRVENRLEGGAVFTASVPVEAGEMALL
jgi:signal transduction histidine kinase